jgi:hypothetical protein
MAAYRKVPEMSESQQTMSEMTASQQTGRKWKQTSSKVSEKAASQQNILEMT